MGEVRILRHILMRMNKPYVWLAFLCFAFFTAIVPQPVYAYNFGTSVYLLDTVTGKTCPGPDCAEVLRNSQQHKVETCPGRGLARRIIPCIKATILMGTNDFLLPFSNYLARIVQVCCILAVTLWAVHMISGSETAPLKDAMVMALKIGFVILFTMNFGGNSLDPTNTHNGNFGIVLDIMEEMLKIVTGYVVNASRFGIEGSCYNNGADVYQVNLVWNAIDCAVDTLVGGIFSPLTLSAGILGFILACLFSNTVGFTIGITMIYLIYKMLYAIFKCCYIFLSAYLGIAFMVVISPLFIPTILFKATKTYFEKWLKLFISFMIQPMILFAYLAMLLAGFDTVVFSEKNKNSLYSAIAGQDPCFFRSVKTACATGPGGKGWGSNMGDWLLNGGFYTNVDVGAVAVTIDSKAIKDAGLIPKEAKDLGAAGEITLQMLDYVRTRQAGTMNLLGVDGNKPNFFQISIPSRTVQWDKVARANKFDGKTPEKNTTSYLLKLLVSAFMALITGYIFVEMLEVIPFIGSAMAMGGGMVDGKGLTGGLGIDKLTGGSDVTKALKFGAKGSRGSTSSTGSSMM